MAKCNMTDIELLWHLAEIREISRQQVKAQVAPLIALAEAYHGLVEMLLEDRPEVRADLERIKALLDNYQENSTR